MEIINERGGINLSKWMEKKRTCVNSSMGLQVCSELARILFKHIPLHEQGHLCSIIMLMEAGQDLKSTPNVCKKLKRMLYSCAPPIMPPNHHPCINANEHKFFGGLSHHPMEERINTKKGITKKHAKLQY